MPVLLGDFIERNTVVAIVGPPKFHGHPGVHGIDAGISRLRHTPYNGTIRTRFFHPFR
jgi:hypothetical protein